MLTTAAEFVRSEVRYGVDLVGAGLDGVASAWDGTAHRVLPPRSATPMLASAVVGAGLGLASALHRDPRRPGRVVLTGLLGSAVGFGVGLAWMSRRFTQDAARSATRTISAARDAHWLQRNPIPYG